jgi:hypothetical protein
VTAVRTEELDLLVPEFLPVAIELAFALRAGHPKNLRHALFLLISGNKIRNPNIEIRNLDDFSGSFVTTETQSRVGNIKENRFSAPSSPLR